MALHRHTIEPAYHLKYEVLDRDGGLIAGFVKYEDRELFIIVNEEEENNKRLRERIYRLKKE
ncbi:hypothetical protein KAW18_02540 [candidate division WOR-3 bacterium]|nr:hypothetical protein [candidate division WOR-3 bacterium]